MKEVLSKIDQSLNFLPIGRFYDRGVLVHGVDDY